MTNPTSQKFERSLKSAIGRLSRANYDYAIREVVEHFQDILDETLAEGKLLAQATTITNRRIGVVGDIARKIVDSPSRVRSGIRLQWFAAVLWAVTPFVSWQVMRFIAPVRNPIAFPDLLIVVVGILAVVGGFRASKIEWKPVALALTFFAAFTVFTLVRSAPRDAKFVAERAKEKQERLETGLQYERFETAMTPCLLSFNDVKPTDLEKLRTVVRSTNFRTGISIYTSKNKWIFPYEHQYKAGNSYTFGFGTTNNLEDAQMMWQKMKTVSAQWPAMVADRKSITEVGYALSRASSLDNFFQALPRPAQLGMSVGISVIWPYLYGFLLGALLLRLYVYRLDSFKLRLTRN